jgi:cytochrome c oxidase subunit IV
MASENHAHHEPASLVTYIGTFLALMVLTVITVIAGFQNFGVWNTPIALGIAVTKAAMVVLIFMHAYHSSPVTKLVIVASVFFLVIMIGMTLSDYISRGWTL